MKYTKLIVFFLAFILPNILYAGQKLLAPCSVLELESIGFPTMEKERAAWPIRDLMFFKEKLYIGHGDAVVNTGPTDIIYYDLDKKEFVTEFTVDDEAIYYYQVVNNTLMIPGIDATEDWSFGNFYILTDNGWIKQRTIPNGLHVNDLEWFDEQLFASTGSIGKVGKEIEYALGGIFASSDTGRTWLLSYATPGDDKSIYRIQSLIAYKDELYAFPFAYSALTKDDIPVKYHEALSKPYGQDDEFLVFRVDIFGNCDVLSFNTRTWQCQDIIPADNICYVAKPFVFKEKLCIPVLFGEYIDYLHKDRQLVPQAKTVLFSFDGQQTKEIKFDYDRLSDVLVVNDTLYLLIEKDSLFYIAETENLKNWRYYLIPSAIKKPQSIEYANGLFYVGAVDGNIFVSIQNIPVKKSREAENIVPRNFYGAAELPRDGKWYWTAIKALQNWGQLGWIIAEIKYGNVIKINTSNISSISVFPPAYHLDPKYETILIIDGQVVFEGFLSDASELICVQSEDSGAVAWDIVRGKAEFKTYTPEKHLIGKTEMELTRQSENSVVGYWKADVIRYAGGTDLAIINYSSIRNDIISSSIFLEDIYDANYPDILCKFKMSGKELTALLEYNLNQSEDRRCHIAGFTVEYRTEGSNIKIIKTTLDQKKVYTVATEKYLAEQAQRFLGRDIEYTKLEKNTYQAMIEWFSEHEVVKDIVPRIKALP